MSTTQTPEQITARKALEALGFALTCEFVPFSKSRNAKPDPEVKDLSLNWEVTLTYNGRDVITTDYMQGIGHAEGGTKYSGGYSQAEYARLYDQAERGQVNPLAYYARMYPPTKGKRIPPPTLPDVMHCLLMDADALNYRNFEQWASNYGYDTDSREAEKIYRACLDIALQFRGVVPDDAQNQAREILEQW